MKCISLVIWNAYCYYLLLFCIRLSIATAIHTGYTIHSLIDSNTSVPSATSSVQNEHFFHKANQRPSNYNHQQLRHGINANAHLRHSTHNQRHQHNHQPLPYHQTHNNHSSTIIRNSIVESKSKQSHDHKGRNKFSQHTTTIPSKKTNPRPMINRHHHFHHPHQWATHSNTAVTYTQSPYSINSGAAAAAAPSMKRIDDDSNANWPKVFDTTTVAPEEIQTTVATTHPHSHQYKQQHHHHHTEAQLPSTLQSNYEYNRPLAAQNDISVNNERRKAQQRQINSQIPNRIDIPLWNMDDDDGDGDTNIDSTNNNDHDDNNNDDEDYDVSKTKAKINLQITSFSHYTDLRSNADNFHFNFNSHIFPK
jgi:hypothetical protein